MSEVIFAKKNILNIHIHILLGKVSFMSLIFSEYFNLVPNFFFNSIYFPNISQAFQCYNLVDAI